MPRVNSVWFAVSAMLGFAAAVLVASMVWGASNRPEKGDGVSRPAPTDKEPPVEHPQRRTPAESKPSAAPDDLAVPTQEAEESRPDEPRLSAHVERLLQQLSGTDIAARNAAADALEALVRTDEGLRRAILTRLRWAFDHGVSNGLIEAGIVLARLNDPETIDALLRIVDQIHSLGDWQREYALTASAINRLRERAGYGAVQMRLAELYSDPTPVVQIMIVEKLLLALAQARTDAGQSVSSNLLAIQPYRSILQLRGPIREPHVRRTIPEIASPSTAPAVLAAYTRLRPCPTPAWLRTAQATTTGYVAPMQMVGGASSSNASAKRIGAHSLSPGTAATRTSSWSSAGNSSKPKPAIAASSPM